MKDCASARARTRSSDPTSLPRCLPLFFSISLTPLSLSLSLSLSLAVAGGPVVALPQFSIAGDGWARRTHVIVKEWPPIRALDRERERPNMPRLTLNFNRRAECRRPPPSKRRRAGEGNGTPRGPLDHAANDSTKERFSVAYARYARSLGCGCGCGPL